MAFPEKFYQYLKKSEENRTRKLIRAAFDGYALDNDTFDAVEAFLYFLGNRKTTDPEYPYHILLVSDAEERCSAFCGCLFTAAKQVCGSEDAVVSVSEEELLHAGSMFAALAENRSVILIRNCTMRDTEKWNAVQSVLEKTTHATVIVMTSVENAARLREENDNLYHRVLAKHITVYPETYEDMLLLLLSRLEKGGYTVSTAFKNEIADYLYEIYPDRAVLRGKAFFDDLCRRIISRYLEHPHPQKIIGSDCVPHYIKKAASAAETAVEEVPVTEAPAVETPAEKPAVETPADKPAAEAPADKPAAEAPAEKPAAEAPAEKPAAEVPAEKPAAEVPAEKPAAEVPAEKPAAEVPVPKTPEAEKPAEAPAVRESPVFDAFNDDTEPFLRRAEEEAADKPLNILLLSLSTFPPNHKLNETRFYFNDAPDKEKTADYVTGAYQLDPILDYLRRTCGTEAEPFLLDGAVLLSTKATRRQESIDINFLDGRESKHRNGISPLKYYEERLSDYLTNNTFPKESKTLSFDLDTEAPASAISQVVRFITSLNKTGKKVHLYLDTHGGLRNTQLILESIISLLDESQVSVFSYEVQYDPNGISRFHEDTSMEMFTFGSGIREFLNYGRIESLNQTERVKNSPILEPIKKIANSIQWCDINGFEKGLSELKRIKESEPENTTDDPYLKMFTERIFNDYGSLLDTNSAKESFNAAEALRWCLKKGFYQQALTVVESKMGEYLINHGILRTSENTERLMECLESTPYKIDAAMLMNGCVFSFGSFSKKLSKNSNAFNNELFIVCSGACIDDSKLNSLIITYYGKVTTVIDNMLEKGAANPSVSYKPGHGTPSINDLKNHIPNQYPELSKYLYTISFEQNDMILPDAFRFYKDFSYRRDLFVLIALHKRLKEMRNNSNHGNDFTVKPQKILNALKTYLATLDRLCAKVSEINVSLSVNSI